MSIKIIEMFIPKSNKYTRPGRKITPKFITIHETDNEDVRANARAHALLQANGNRRQASWHFTVDDEPEVYQSLPLTEESFHAGTKRGNIESISIEMCVNRDGNYMKTLNNTVSLVNYIMKKFPTIKAVNVVQHYHWSGKNCPRKLRSGETGVDWNVFLKRVKSGNGEVIKPSKPPKHIPNDITFKKGQKVKLKQSASHYETGEKIPNKYKGKQFTIQQRGSNRMLLKELYSWVHTKDLEVVETKQEAKKVTVGGKVKLKSSATHYATGEKIPSQYKNKTYTVQQIKANQILLKELYSWVYTKDVELNSKEQRQTTPNKLVVGGKVKLKANASKYATGESIPSKYKNKTYTIQQIKSDRVLLKELYSWVQKTDLD